MKLLVFTQKVDKNDSVLGFFHSWILEFSKHFDSVEVICLEKGDFDLPKNVRVHSLGKELGGGKILYLQTSIKYLYLLNNKYDRVFVHMNPIYIVLGGFYWKLRNIPVFLWYTHRQVDLKLKIAIFFARNVFSSTKESMAVATNKVFYIGHGIDVVKFPNTSHLYTMGTLRIAHIGRISRIKNIETIIDAVYELKSKSNCNLELFLYGDTVTAEDRIYKEELVKLIEDKDLKRDIAFKGWIKQAEIPVLLSDFHLTVNMAPRGGMDKSVLESILLGLPTFVANTAFADLFGQYGRIFLFQYGNSHSLTEKIYEFINMAHTEGILNSLDSKVRSDFSVETVIGKMLPFIIK